MKKGIKCGLVATAVATILTASALVGCGGSEEERFKEATTKFNNYTVTIDVAFTDGDEQHSELQIDGTAGKLTITHEQAVYTDYFKKENASVYYYGGKSSGWRETDASTIERATEEYGAEVHLFQSLFYDDFEKSDDYLKMKDSALVSNSTKYLSLESVKIILKGNVFASAVVVADLDGLRCQVNYTFKDYGKTHVTLPDA